jgi:hypothetical protein
MIGSSPIAWLAITGSDYVAVTPGTFVAAWARNRNTTLDEGDTMKKNVAGQAIGAQMCSATDGSAFTGAVTVYVCGDAGAQAIGSVGAGACTHEGNGYHTYAPAQAETNYNLIGFTFIGSGAIPSTVQVATSFPQTVDLSTGITAGTITTVTTTTNLTNLPTIPANWLTAAGTASDFGAEMATAIWTDTTAGDFTVAASIGKSVMNGVALGTGLTINGYTGNTVQTGDSFARIGVAGAGLTNIDLPNQTMDIVGNITGNLSGSVGSVTGAVGSVTGAVGSVTGAVGSVTGNVGGNVVGSVASVTAVVSADITKIGTDTTALTAFKRAVMGNVIGTVGAASTTTSIVTSSLTPAAAVIDQFKGRIVIFDKDTATANLRGQGTDITASTALGVLTVTALTTAPASGDTFVIS